MFKRWGLLICGLFLLTGCFANSMADVPIAADAAPTATVAPFLVEDQAAGMAGICFEAALDAVGQVFVLRDAEDHIRFYELADNSKLCRNPVERNPFDFDGGRVLVGLWSAGTGCTADHTIDSMTRDDDAQQIIIELTFSTAGDCDYELVRPFWIALDNAADYAIEVVVSEVAN